MTDEENTGQTATDESGTQDPPADNTAEAGATEGTEAATEQGTSNEPTGDGQAAAEEGSEDLDNGGDTTADPAGDEGDGTVNKAPTEGAEGN